jgi:hypothetical protein
MLFSEHFVVVKTAGDDWFDTILDYDTRLFLDPFLILKAKHPLFRKSHDKIIDFFSHVFTDSATASRNTSSMSYQRLLYLNVFPEVRELCLGYANKSTKGSGSGLGYAANIVQAVFESIDLGLTSLKHFEELGIIHKGIGPDRISDMTANILKAEFIAYTQSICSAHSISMKSFPQKILNRKTFKWEMQAFDLPINPYTNEGVILVPEKFLNYLPEINDYDFYNYCVNNNAQQLRVELNTDILSKIDKEKIIELAKNHRDWVDMYLKFKELQQNPTHYDLKADPKGIYQWAVYSRKYVDENPIKITATNKQTFLSSIQVLVDEFQKFIELRGGQKLLWDNSGRNSKPEEASQLLFYGNSRLYCSTNNIVLDREVYLGVGPVDFKFSNGYKNRALLEVKLARNSKFWNGLEKQLTKYMESDNISDGYFMVICYTDKDLKKVKAIEDKVTALNKKLKINIKVCVIDATYKKTSASKL